MKRLSALMIMVLVSAVGVVGVNRVEAQPIPKTSAARETETLQDVRLILEDIDNISNALNNLTNTVNNLAQNVNNTKPLWSQTLPASARFELALGGAGVLDNETGLVWEKSPSTVKVNWYDAQGYCLQLSMGGRLGCRLPSIQELASLADQTQTNPALPPGHPFSNVQKDSYWSSSTQESSTASRPALVFDFSVGAFFFVVDVKIQTLNYWCVRGR
jgi:hypothetical protein